MKLKGEKIILRPLKIDDAQRFVKWLKDPEVNKFTTRKPVNLKEEKIWIRKVTKNRKEDLHLAIDAEEGVHIGSIGLFFNLRDKNATFDILIGDKKYWDGGYGTDAAKTIINYGFKKFNLHRIQLQVLEYNPRAIKVYKKLGFKTEGVGREKALYKSKFYNNINMGILEREWKKNKNQNV